MTEDVPGYRVLAKVGEGGCSVVYRAYQERLDRQVALKVLSISAVDDAAMQRFQRECKITGRLSGHPNVVTVLDTGTTRSGRPYIVMEYFEHGALTDRLQREGPLPVPEVLRIGVKMAGALAATHETEVLHRDVKPQNILVSRYGEPALADFGIARLVDSFETAHTQAFTPHHAAPEVLEGRQPGVRSDIYSLGSTLYQLLAGVPAFKGPAGEGIAQLVPRILNEPLPPLPRDDVPPQVMEVIGQAMAKAEEQRFPTALAFAQRLQQLQTELALPVTEIAHTGAIPVPWLGTAPQLTVPPDPTRVKGRGPRTGVLAAVTAALVGGITLGVAGIGAFGGEKAPPAPAVTPAVTPQQATAPAPSANKKPQIPAPIPVAKVRAATPRRVRVVADRGISVGLRWQLPPVSRKLRILVQRTPSEGRAVISAGTGATSVTVKKLRRERGYCFRVGAVLRAATAQSPKPVIAWAPPKCLRGARLRAR
jgi:protein kinase-like protein